MKKQNDTTETPLALNRVVSRSAYRLTRDVTKKECNWLDRKFKKGELVYSYSGATYGCISYNGSAFTLVEGETPFFELPDDAVEHCG